MSADMDCVARVWCRTKSVMHNDKHKKWQNIPKYVSSSLLFVFSLECWTPLCEIELKWKINQNRKKCLSTIVKYHDSISNFNDLIHSSLLILITSRKTLLLLVRNIFETHALSVGWPSTIDIRHRGIGLLQPVYQPLSTTVTLKHVTTQIPAKTVREQSAD